MSNVADPLILSVFRGYTVHLTYWLPGQGVTAPKRVHMFSSILLAECIFVSIKYKVCIKYKGLSVIIPLNVRLSADCLSSAM